MLFMLDRCYAYRYGEGIRRGNEMTIQTAHITDRNYTAHIGPHWAAWLYDETGRCIAYACGTSEDDVRAKVVDPKRSIR
jgi:hypothetical protein